MTEKYTIHATDANCSTLFAVTVECERISVDDRRSVHKIAENLGLKYKFPVANKEEKTE